MAQPIVTFRFDHLSSPAPTKPLVETTTRVDRLDEAADIDDFCQEISDRLVGVLTLRIGDRLVAEEIAQEALAKAVVSWADVSRMHNPGGWVYRIALNLAASRFRRVRAERRAMQRAQAATPPVVRSVDGSAQALEFRALIQRLSRRQQEVIALRFYADESVESTAAILGVTEGTVKTLTHRALRMLRRHLDEDAALPGPQTGSPVDRTSREAGR